MSCPCYCSQLVCLQAAGGPVQQQALRIAELQLQLQQLQAQLAAAQQQQQQPSSGDSAELARLQETLEDRTSEVLEWQIHADVSPAAAAGAAAAVVALILPGCVACSTCACCCCACASGAADALLCSAHWECRRWRPTCMTCSSAAAQLMQSVRSCSSSWRARKRELRASSATCEVSARRGACGGCCCMATMCCPCGCPGSYQQLLPPPLLSCLHRCCAGALHAAVSL